MTVAELRTLLAAQPDDARVFIFDTPREGVTGTLAVNCVLSMSHDGPIVILEHDTDEAERLAGASTHQRTQTILAAAVKEASARPLEWPDQICPSCGVAFGMHKLSCEASGRALGARITDGSDANVLSENPSK